ncbi:MAG: SPASM domain-containing protein [Candidatus Aureabacteria bacterium]|nr:SPASM domain-containing protein [Candidatus Auribacterota bacterium]
MRGATNLAVLTIDEIEKVSRSMDDFLFLLPTGGEPFLRKDLAEIVAIFHRNNRVQNVGIPTNGSLTAQVVETVRAIMRSCPNLDLMVDVSMDGIGSDHDEIRRFPGLFEKASATFRELKKLEKEYPRFTSTIETTVSSYNDAKLLEMYDYFTTQAGADTIFTLLTRGKPMEPAAKYFNIDNYEKYARAMEEGMRKRTLTGYARFPLADLINAKRIIRHRIIARVIRENRMILPCFGGTLGAALFANGDVLPCELHADLKMGNLREAGYDFKKIWFGPEAGKARRAIHDNKCFCTYECFLTLNILFNPRMYPLILLEYARIKWAKLSGTLGL